MKIEKIEKIAEDKKRFLDLLLIADEEEQMIDKYLESGEVFVLCDNGLKSICVVSNEKNTYEIKNLATYPRYQNQGYATKLIQYVLDYYKSKNDCISTNNRDSKNKDNIQSSKENNINNKNLNKNTPNKNTPETIYVGTGDCENIIKFYEKFGFEKSHRIKNFFIDNYSKAIFENGKQLIDMVYLKRDLKRDLKK